MSKRLIQFKPVNRDTEMKYYDVKSRMAGTVGFSIYLYMLIGTFTLILNGFNWVASVFYFPFLAIIPYILIKFYRTIRLLNDVGAGFYTLSFTLLFFTGINFAGDTVGNDLLNFVWIILATISLSIPFVIFYSARRSNIKFGEALLLISQWLWTLVSKDRREQEKEFKQLFNLFYMDCDPEQYIIQAEIFLSKPQVSLQHELMLSYRIYQAKGFLGDYDEAIYLIEKFISRYQTEPKVLRFFKLFYVYDTLTYWALLNGNMVKADKFSRLRDEPTKEVRDETMMISTNYQMVKEKRYDEVLKNYEERRSYQDSNNIKRTTLLDVSDQFHMAEIYEALGEITKQQETLLFVAKVGNKMKFA